MQPWEFDGMRMGYAADPHTIVEVWEPRWWQILRWVKWLFAKRHYLIGRVKLEFGGQKVTVRVVDLEGANAWRGA